MLVYFIYDTRNREFFNNGNPKCAWASAGAAKSACLRVHGCSGKDWDKPRNYWSKGPRYTVEELHKDWPEKYNDTYHRLSFKDQKRFICIKRNISITGRDLEEDRC